MGVIDMVNGKLCETLPVEEIEQIRNEGYEQGRADAIDDFLDWLLKNYCIKDDHMWDMEKEEILTNWQGR